jgi:superfamily II DNA or RNA helicase
MQCGPVRFKVDARQEAAARPFDHRVVLESTSFRLQQDDRDPGIEEIYSKLTADEGRMALIVADVFPAVQAGRSPLVLTERTEHLDRLAGLLDGQVQHLLVLRGGLGARERKRLAVSFKSIPDDESWVLLATGPYIGKGFDDARLDTLFLALPVSWHGTIQQYAGRLHRLHAGKRVAQVCDYVDADVPMLLTMHKE